MPSPPSSTSGSSSEDNDWSMPDYVHMLLLSPASEDDRAENGPTRVLMQRQHAAHAWDLPYFAYPQPLESDRCAADLEHLLSAPTLSDRRAFAVVAELLGVHGSNGIMEEDPVGFARLLLIEPQIPVCDLILPKHAEWKDACFLSSLLNSTPLKLDNDSALKVGLKYLRPSPDPFAEHRDPRYRLGWFDAAVRWFRAEVARDGATPTGQVVQEHVSSSSTLLSLESSAGTFYLKSPALGWEEVNITAAVASIFPDDTVDVLDTSKELNSFIMRGFEHIDVEESHDEAFVKKLGHIQLQSLQHLDTLKDAGCEERGPDQIAEKLQEWANDETNKSIFHGKFDKLKEQVPLLVNLCSQLSTYNVPLTLVHGDFAKHNATIVSAEGGMGGAVCGERDGKHCDDKLDSSAGNILLFDWQFACISHPFCDLHQVHRKLSEDAVNAYLDLWSEYESRERAQEAFELARRLGWCLKIWSELSTVGQCDLQYFSERGDFIKDMLELLTDQLHEMSSLSEDAECKSRNLRLPDTHMPLTPSSISCTSGCCETA